MNLIISLGNKIKILKDVSKDDYLVNHKIIYNTEPEKYVELKTLPPVNSNIINNFKLDDDKINTLINISEKYKSYLEELNKVKIFKTQNDNLNNKMIQNLNSDNEQKTFFVNEFNTELRCFKSYKNKKNVDSSNLINLSSRNDKKTDPPNLRLINWDMGVNDDNNYNYSEYAGSQFNTIYEIYYDDSKMCLYFKNHTNELKKNVKNVSSYFPELVYLGNHTFDISFESLQQKLFDKLYITKEQAELEIENIKNINKNDISYDKVISLFHECFSFDKNEKFNELKELYMDQIIQYIIFDSNNERKIDFYKKVLSDYFSKNNINGSNYNLYISSINDKFKNDKDIEKLLDEKLKEYENQVMENDKMSDVQ